MAKNSIFCIKVIKWHEHNPKHRATYKRTMIANNMTTDGEVNAMPLSCRWLFLHLLLICGDTNNDTVTMTERQVNEVLTGKVGAKNALDLLQQYQLVTYDNAVHPLLNKIKKLNKGNKEIKESSSGVEKQPPPVRVENPQKDSNKKVWEAYQAAYFSRYKEDPVRNASVNSQISQLVKRLGEADAISVVKFYLTHNDSFYVKKVHPIGLCLSDAEGLRTQMLRGKAITGTNARQFEKRSEGQQQVEFFRRLSEQTGNDESGE